MAHATPEWSEQRRHAANLVACVLYGVIAIMTVELAIDPGRFRYLEGAAAALVVGAVIAMTRFVVEVVKKETETGTHLPLVKMASLFWESWLVLAFPALVAAIIVVSGALGMRVPALLDSVFYLGIAAVFLLGLGSSYVLDGRLGHALRRGLSWTVLSLILSAIKILL
jgi:hypothetical protein